jgi:hypothetical protein
VIKFKPWRQEIGNALNKKKEFAITLNLINATGHTIDEKGHYIVQLDPMMVLLFDGIETTRTSRMLNSILTKPATKRLYQFFLSHGGLPHNMTLKSYHAFLGSQINIEEKQGYRNFKRKMIEWLTDLEKIGAILKDWEIIDDKICNITATKLDLETVY